MDNPAYLLRLAKQNQRRVLLQPAPMAEEKTVVIPSGHTSSHANYTALMRSHDRISTRHIAPRSGA